MVGRTFKWQSHERHILVFSLPSFLGSRKSSMSHVGPRTFPLLGTACAPFVRGRVRGLRCVAHAVHVLQPSGEFMACSGTETVRPQFALCCVVDVVITGAAAPLHVLVVASGNLCYLCYVRFPHRLGAVGGLGPLLCVAVRVSACATRECAHCAPGVFGPVTSFLGSRNGALVAPLTCRPCAWLCSP